MGQVMMPRIPVMRTCQESGLLDRAILNSIDHNTNDEYLSEIKDIGVQSSILLAFENRHLLPEKKSSFSLAKGPI